MTHRTASSEVCKELEDKAYLIRRASLELITWAQWGHVGGSFSMAEILACLYFREMRIDPAQPAWNLRDRLILSKAHGSPALYAALALRGFFPMDHLYTYCDLGGLDGHTDMNKTPGIESSGGPLGQGLSIAVGKALALRYQENAHNRVYCLLGDGEINEGQIWEAAMSASHYGLDNLIAIVDYNKVMGKGFVRELMGLEPLADKWRAFGWEVLEVDGHDVPALLRTLRLARRVKVLGKPIVIIAHTIKGCGVEWMEFNYKWHTHAPDPSTADRALKELARNYGRREEGYSRLGMAPKVETFPGAN